MRLARRAEPMRSADPFRQNNDRFSAPRTPYGGMDTPTTLERAFALARSGACASVNDIRVMLKRERFDQVEAHLAGASIARQLRGLCDQARRPVAP
jgi:hypothetical protein